MDNRRNTAEIPVDQGSDDRLGLEPYAKQLTEFAKTCVTPTTIAIQGSWGSGKTSLLRMMKSMMDDSEYLFVEFDTWQYSQFKLADSLSVFFLTTFLKNLQKDLGESGTSTLKETLTKLGSLMAKKTALYTAEKIGGDGLKDMAQEACDIIADKPSGVEAEADAIGQLKEQIEKCIKEIKKKGKKRIVIAIDNLDRLDPLVAIELLEIIKIFLDCEGCVYLLAVDNQIIKQGIRQKYNLTEEKADSFFEKLIQLPFVMPVSYYQFDSFVENIFPANEVFDYQEEFFCQLKPDEQTECIELLSLASGKNPRAAKRIVNAFVLEDMVHRGKEECKEKGLQTIKILLAMSCLQTRLEPDYQTIIDKASSYEKFEKWLLSNDNINLKDSILEYKFRYTPEQIQQYRHDKMLCQKMIIIFKSWCNDYIDVYAQDIKRLQTLIRSTNGRDDNNDSKDYSIIARCILTEIEHGLSQLRAQAIKECMDKIEQSQERVLWIEEAKEVLASSPITFEPLSRQEIWEKFFLLENAEENGVLTEKEVADIVGLYESLNNFEFRYAYSSMIKDIFLGIVADELDMGYEEMQKLEDKIEERLHALDAFLLPVDYVQYFDYKRARIANYIGAHLGKCVNNLLVDDKEAYKDIFKDLWELVWAFIVKKKVLSQGNSMWSSKYDFSSRFSESVMLSDENKREKFEKIAQVVHKNAFLSNGECANIQRQESDKYKTAWKSDVSQRAEIIDGLRYKIFSYEETFFDSVTFQFTSKVVEESVYDEWFQESFNWILAEGEAIKEIDKQLQDSEVEMPEDYEKNRLIWYFGIVSALAYFENYIKKGELLSSLRKKADGHWKRIFKAVDIVKDEFLKKPEAGEKKNSDSFRKVCWECLEELKDVRNSEEWGTDCIHYGPSKEELIKMIDEFLAYGDEVFESVRGSYELGMLIGRLLDTPGFAPIEEGGYLWRYYETYQKVINQIRIKHEECQKFLNTFLDSQVFTWVPYAETEGFWENRDSSSLSREIEKLLQEKVFEVGDKILDKKPDISAAQFVHEALKKQESGLLEEYFERAAIYNNIIGLSSVVSKYFNVRGQLIYHYIPDFMDLVKTGELNVSNEVLERFYSRNQKFWKKYADTLEVLKRLAGENIR